jgi:hypothetical protein
VTLSGQTPKLGMELENILDLRLEAAAARMMDDES